MKKFVLTILFLLPVPLVWAIGNFNMLITQHVDVLYENGLEMAAYRLYQKADEIFESLEKRFESSPKTRVKVYLLKSDVSNGYANPLNNVIVIYVSDMNPYSSHPDTTTGSYFVSVTSWLISFWQTVSHQRWNTFPSSATPLRQPFRTP